MTNPKKSGQRVGDWFLWIECEAATTDNYRKIPIVTIREAVKGGDILSTVVATPELANELRAAADGIDAVIAGLKERQPAAMAS